MLERLFNPFRELDRRVKVTLVGTGIYNWSQWLSATYNVLFAKSLGASAFDIGLINSIGSAVKLVCSIPMGSAAEKYSVKRMMLLGFIFDVISAGIFAFSGNWWVLIPAFVLHGRIISIPPLADIIFVTVTEPKKRSTVMSLSRVFWGMLNVFAPITAAVIVNYYGNGQINTQGIRPLYYIEIVLYALVFFYIAKELGPISSNNKKDRSGSGKSNIIQDWREFFKGEKYLKRWIVIRLIETFGQNFSTSFIPLWLVIKGASPYIIGAISTVSMIVGLALSIPAGRLADKIGRKKAFFIFAPFN